MTTVTLNGKTFDFDAIINLMDDEIREDLNIRISGCTEQEFINAYVKAHAEKFDGEEFEIN
jgi:phosphotransferase system HPr-like phosphotransfer protein